MKRYVDKSHDTTKNEVQIMTSKRKIINSNIEVLNIFLSLAIIFLFSSCLPLKQTYGDFNDQGVTVMGESKHVVININPDNYPSEPEILSEISYAVHESGDQYPLIVNPEEILEYRNSKYVISDYLYLKAPKNYLTKYKS